VYHGKPSKIVSISLEMHMDIFNKLTTWNVSHIGFFMPFPPFPSFHIYVQDLTLSFIMSSVIPWRVKYCSIYMNHHDGSKPPNLFNSNLGKLCHMLLSIDLWLWGLENTPKLKFSSWCDSMFCAFQGYSSSIPWYEIRTNFSLNILSKMARLCNIFLSNFWYQPFMVF